MLDNISYIIDYAVWSYKAMAYRGLQATIGPRRQKTDMKVQSSK